MAEHADTAERELTPVQATPARPVVPATIVAGIGSAVVIAVLLAVGGWLWLKLADENHAVEQRTQLVQAARQGAVNLTTIAYPTVDADVKRILDSSTGAFREDFQKRATSFANAVKQARSTSVGTITDAGLLSQNGNQAKVLVAVAVKMRSEGQPEGPTKPWRMELTVERVGADVKVSDVQFVS